MDWIKVTNIILYASFVILAVFLFIAIDQLIKRKSLGKVDKALLWMPLPLVLMVITYFLFDKILPPLATRPNGSGEPSFPSTHVMVVATIFFLAMINIHKYIKSKTARIVLEILMIILLALTCAGRVIANMHSPVDVVGGLLFAFVFTEIYRQILRHERKKTQNA